MKIHRLRAALLALALVVCFGFARLPLENHLARAQRAAGFGTVPLGLGLREQVGQLGFLAALSGFRALVADLVWLEAHAAWERVEYGRVNLLCGTATTLEPRNVDFWDQSAWHMAWNAAARARDPSPAQAIPSIPTARA